MTRRGVVRWAARAFREGTVVKLSSAPGSGACVVELELPTRDDYLSLRMVRWTTGHSWGECVRKLEAHFLFGEDGFSFRSQILVHERKDEFALRALGGLRLPPQQGHRKRRLV